jgi:class 3 adenylate cyclase
MENFFKLIPEQISTGWMAPLVAVVFACWHFFRKQAELEKIVAEKNDKVASLQSALEQQIKSKELLHKRMLDLQTQMDEIDALLVDARVSIKASADSIFIKNPYSEDILVFLMAHGPAADKVAKLQISIKGSQAGKVFSSKQTSMYSENTAAQRHDGRLDKKSGYQSKNMLTKPLLRHGNEVVGVVQFLNEDADCAFTSVDEKNIEVICNKLALAVGAIVAEPSNLVNLGMVFDPQVNQATLVFTDISHSESLFRSIPVADASAMIDEYLERLSRIGLQFDARIDKYLGDGILFSFESQTSSVENASKAVQAALLMQAEFQNILAEWKRLGYQLPLAHRVGIASGAVFGRRMGYAQSCAYTVMGLPVHMAAGLCNEARNVPGHALVCPETYRQAQARLIGSVNFKQHTQQDGQICYEIESN